MKEITYSDKKKFLLTDKEFKNAVLAWSEKANYWCQRLEASLSSFIAYAETPEVFWHRNVYTELDKGTERHYFVKKDGRLFQIIGEKRDDVVEIDLRNPKFKELMGNKLVKQEDYYNFPEEQKRERLQIEFQRQDRARLEPSAKSMALAPQDLDPTKGGIVPSKI